MFNCRDTFSTRCNACKLVATDLYAATTIAPKAVSVLDIVENSCEKLGYNHKPYAWMETFCDEMIEDRASKHHCKAIVF
jgi:hypothetical protein